MTKQSIVQGKILFQETLKSLLKNTSIELNLKMLAQLSVLEKETFSKIVEKVKTS